MAGIIIVGGTTGSKQEVEAASLAARAALLPVDPGTGGAYRKALRSGTIGAGIAGASPVYSFRYGGALTCIVKKIIVSVGFSTAFAPGFFTLDAFAARAFSASDTSGNAGTLTGNNAKLRTSYPATGMADIRIANTGTLSAGTRTLDADPFGTFVATANVLPGGSTTNPSTSAPFDLMRAAPGDETLTLVNNEGFVIQTTVPATGTWMLGVDVTWVERSGTWV
jgi:hypothetical protein